MLADLDQSKQLMDKFCDSELLESLDMLLTTSRLHKPHEVKSTTIDNCDQTCVVNHVSTYVKIINFLSLLHHNLLNICTNTPNYLPLTQNLIGVLHFTKMGYRVAPNFHNM